MSDPRDDRFGPASYLTPEEAREFHRLFLTGFIIFTLIAIVAHFLVWSWRPWIPGPEGYAALDTNTPAVAAASATASA